MSTYVSLDKEEYDRLLRMERVALEQSQTLDMILDEISESAYTLYDTTVVVGRISKPEGIANIFRYRMPEQWREFEIAVAEREKREEADERD